MRHKLPLYAVMTSLVSFIFVLPLYAQLATTPWPMFRHDAGHTGQSAYAGPSIPRLGWSYRAASMVDSSPAVGTDGSVCVGSWDDHLYAILPDGTLKWSYRTMSTVDSSPAIDSAGAVYIGSNDNCIYSITAGGTRKWSYRTGSDIFPSPALGSDGKIYIGSRDHFYALSSNGTLNWSYPNYAVNLVDENPSPALGSDGNVYFGSDDNTISAVSSIGTLNWSYRFVGML